MAAHWYWANINWQQARTPLIHNTQWGHPQPILRQKISCASILLGQFIHGRTMLRSVSDSGWWSNNRYRAWRAPHYHSCKLPPFFCGRKQMRFTRRDQATRKQRVNTKYKLFILDCIEEGRAQGGRELGGRRAPGHPTVILSGDNKNNKKGNITIKSTANPIQKTTGFISISISSNIIIFVIAISDKIKPPALFLFFA